MLVDLAPYAALITAIVAGYLAFRRQQRLKAFELLYERRISVIQDIETELERVFTVEKSIASDSSDDALDFQRRFFHDGLVLQHKIRGARFGEEVEVFTETYFSIVTEAVHADTNFDFPGWIGRLANTLSALYGFAHSSLSYEMEMLTLPWYQRVHRRIRRWRDKRKAVNRDNEEASTNGSAV